MGTNMDVLVIDRFLLYKNEQPNAKEVNLEEYLAQFSLD
jgi:hypothetical protein